MNLGGGSGNRAGFAGRRAVSCPDDYNPLILRQGGADPVEVEVWAEIKKVLGV